MSDWFFGGVFGGYPVDGFGAQQQQANAEHWRKQQEAAMGASLNAHYAGLTCPHPAMNAVVTDCTPPRFSGFAAWRERMEAEEFCRPDWLYWKWLAVMALTCACTMLLAYWGSR